VRGLARAAYFFWSKMKAVLPFNSFQLMNCGDAMSDTASHGPNTLDFEARARDFDWVGNKLETGVGLALSGGGFRAMLFHAGALHRLNELGLLSRVDRISSVSGGSIAAGWLATAWRTLGAPDARGVFDTQTFKTAIVGKLLAFSREKIDVLDVVLGLLPFTSAADQAARSYRKLVGDASLRDLPDSPRFVFCSTNLQTGVLWRFSKPYAGDYVVGYIPDPDIPLAKAMAASAAFPPVLSPLVLEPGVGAFRDWPGDGEAPRVDPAPFRRRVMLSDGGVYDNHGLEPIVKRYMTLLVSDGGAPFERAADAHGDWVRQLRRLLDLTDNQVRALRRRDLVARLQAGNAAYAAGTLKGEAVDPVLRMGAYWGIDTDPGKIAAPGALPCAPATRRLLASTPTRLTDLGETRSKQLINWGYAICDRTVRGFYRGPIPLADAPPAPPYPEAPL
jgi:NTE family protein